MSPFIRKTLLALILLLMAALTAVTVRTRLVAAPDPVPTPVPTPEPTPVSRWRGQVSIGELMEKNKTVVADEDGDFSDWIELVNTGSEAVDLTHWRLSDREDGRGWYFPAVQLAPGERRLVFASKKNRSGDELHTDFGLSGAETLRLFDAEGAPVDEAACGGCAGDVSMARLPDGSWGRSLYPTPGYDNTPEGYEQWQQTQWPLDALVINEVVTANLDGTYVGASTTSDWIELKNLSDRPISLGGYWLSDQEDHRLLWPLPDETLGAGRTLVIACEDDPAVFLGSTLSTGFALASDSEQLYLSTGDGALADAVSLRDIPAHGSYGRLDGQPGWFFFANTTPGQDNVGGARRISTAPVSPTAEGVFDGVDSVTVTLEGEGDVYYTLDGSLPTQESAPYTGPVTLTGTGVLRAVAVQEGALPSRPLNLSFILNEGHSLPVVSLVTDSPKEYFMMYDGWHKGVELSGAVSLFQADGGCFTIPCGVSLNGMTSLSENKKNLALRFRSAYGQGDLNCDIYGGGVTHFTNLLLRAGQDQSHAVIRNELAQNLCDMAGCRVVNQRSLYCALYVNGEYAGLYTLKEKANEQLYADLYGVSRESVRLLEPGMPVDSDLYRNALYPMRFEDITDPAVYARVCETIDIDCLIDWLIIEGFCSNTDVTMGNLRYVSSTENDGKWRILFYDLDAVFSSPYTMCTNLMSDYAAEHIEIAASVVPLMKNAEFRDRFLTRAAELMRSTLNNETVLAEIDRMAAEIRPEVARDLARYGRDVHGFDAAIREMRQMITDYDWQQLYLDTLCRMFSLSQEDRAAYFGDIDGR